MRTLSCTEAQLELASELVEAFDRAAMPAATRLVEIPYYQCGYYGMHLAVDLGSDDWSSWSEFTASRDAVPLGETRGSEYDIFSGHWVLRAVVRE
jgi:hypothetical protein